MNMTGLIGRSYALICRQIRRPLEVWRANEGKPVLRRLLISAGKLGYAVFVLIDLCLSMPLLVLLRRLGLIRWELMNVSTQFIGHLAIEPDLYLKEQKLGLRPPRRGVLLAHEKVSNPALLDLWRAHVKVVDSPLLGALLKPLQVSRSLAYDMASVSIACEATARYGAIVSSWGEEPPLLTLANTYADKGATALKRIGVPQGGWFVCIHCREAGQSSPEHRHRDASIDTFIPFIKSVVSRGGFVVRMGDPQMTPLPEMEGVFDYAHSDLKADWLDIYLCACARAFVGTASGLAQLASTLGTPVAMSNILPVGAVLGFRPGDLGIPKLLAREDGALMAFQEILKSPSGNFRFAQEYTNAGLDIIDNSAEEINELGMELLDRLAGKTNYTEADERNHARFLALLKPGHYSHGSPAEVGRTFLRRHEELIEK